MQTAYNIEPHLAVKASGLTKIYRYRGLISSIFSGRYKSEVRALSDFSMEVKKGEILGIIGANGSGKSTIMKVLSGVTKPTSGTAVIKGKLFAAIEVSGGFNPDLTGYKNLVLTARIWGFSDKEISRLLPEIIEFSNLSEFIHIPVKKYSSGMVSRLASSLIVHTDADIILLDEVLNGSDLSFKYKMHKKVIEENRKGKTFIITSHTINDILSLCTRAIVIQKGEKKYTGPPILALDTYYKTVKYVNPVQVEEYSNYNENNFINVNYLKVSSNDGLVKFDIRITKKNKEREPVRLIFIINNNFNSPVAHIIHEICEEGGSYGYCCTVPAGMIGIGNHFVTFAAMGEGENWTYMPNLCNFYIDIGGKDNDMSYIPGVRIENANWEKTDQS